MHTVNPNYKYSESDIARITRALLATHGLKLAPNGTVLSKDDKIYTVIDRSITIASDQIIGDSKVAESSKLLKLEAAIQESLFLAKDIVEHIVLFPLNFKKNHWSLIAIRFTKNKVIQVGDFDPMHGVLLVDHLRNRLDPIFRKYLAPSFILFKWLDMVCDYPYNSFNCVAQSDATSCGVLVTDFIEQLVVNGKVANHGKSLSVQALFDLRQYHLNVVNDATFTTYQLNDIADVALKPKPQACQDYKNILKTFKEYIESLPEAHRNEFYNAATNFIDCEIKQEELNNPRKHSKQVIDVTFDETCYMASVLIKIWFMEHREELIALNIMHKFFKPDLFENQLVWQDQESDLQNGKDALLWVLTRSMPPKGTFTVPGLTT